MADIEETMLWDVVDDDPRHKQLVTDGWTTGSTKTFVQRDLTSLPQAPDSAAWTISSVAEIGQEEYAALMQRASVGDPFDQTTPEQALAGLRELVSLAGSAYEARHWYAISDTAGDIGVVLPQVFADNPETGSLLYVGVMPNRRGTGLGTALHHFGLTQLAQRGATKYVGSTDIRNTAMVKVFDHNGASETGRQSFYHRSPSD